MSENSENRLVHTQLHHCTSSEVKTQLYPVFLRQRGYTSTNMLFTAYTIHFWEPCDPLSRKNIIFKVLSWENLPFMNEGKFLLMGKVWLMHKSNKLSTVGRGRPEGREDLLCLIFSYLSLKCEFYFTIDSIFPFGQNPKSTCCFWLVLLKFVLLRILM